MTSLKPQLAQQPSLYCRISELVELTHENRALEREMPDCHRRLIECRGRIRKWLRVNAPARRALVPWRVHWWMHRREK